jgi:ABC-type antimicrobial peptide transport system permease subunit
MGGSLLVKTAGNPMNYAQQVREAVLSVDPEQPVNGIQTLNELRGDALVQSRLTTLLLALFAGLALAIAATGLSGVTALMVSQRTREIGIRMALGANRGSVVWLVMREVLVLSVIGVAIGGAGAYAATRLVQKELFGIMPTDTLTMALSAVGIATVAIVSGYLPARRATAIDPMRALRWE